MAGLNFIQGGETSANVDNDMNVRFICKRRDSPISSFFPRNAPLRAYSFGHLKSAKSPENGRLCREKF